MTREASFPGEQGRNYIASQSGGYCSVSWEKTFLFFRAWLFLQERERTYGQVLSRTTSLFSCMWKKHYEKKEREENTPELHIYTLDAAPPRSLLYLWTENLRSETIKGYAIGISPYTISSKSWLFESFPSINQRIDGQRLPTGCGVSNQTRDRWYRIEKTIMSWLARHVRAIEIY